MLKRETNFKHGNMTEMYGPCMARSLSQKRVGHLKDTYRSKSLTHTRQGHQIVKECQ